MGSWTSAPSGHGCPRPNACFSRTLRALTEVLGRDIRANDPWMSAGYPSQKLPPWADYLFLNLRGHPPQKLQNFVVRALGASLQSMKAFLPRRSVREKVSIGAHKPKTFAGKKSSQPRGKARKLPRKGPSFFTVSGSAPTPWSGPFRDHGLRPWPQPPSEHSKP